MRQPGGGAAVLASAGADVMVDIETSGGARLPQATCSAAMRSGVTAVCRSETPAAAGDPDPYWIGEVDSVRHRGPGHPERRGRLARGAHTRPDPLRSGRVRAHLGCRPETRTGQVREKATLARI